MLGGGGREKRRGCETGTVGGGRQGASLLNFTHSSVSDWIHCNSNTNVPGTELKFDKVNIEKMNLLPSLSTPLSETAVHANPTTADFTAKAKTSRPPTTSLACTARALCIHRPASNARHFCLFLCKRACVSSCKPSLFRAKPVMERVFFLPLSRFFFFFL